MGDIVDERPLMASPERVETESSGNARGVKAATRATAPKEAEVEVILVTEEMYSETVLTIMKPVAITMALVIWVCRVVDIPALRQFRSVYMVYDENAATAAQDTTPVILLGAVFNAIVFVVMIVAVTVAFVLLYKYRCMRLIFTWLTFSSGVLLFFFGAIVAYLLVRAYGIPIDVGLFLLLLWNFAGVGVVALFWAGPKRLQQAYLILISAFMAIFFTRMPDFTTWTILFAVACYDVFAVLCPRGPLKMLVEIAQERGEPIPALLYNGAAFIMMAKPDDDDILEALESSAAEDVAVVEAGGDDDDLLDPGPKKPEPRGVKLGLGDFVFYSVLVGRAAMYDWITVFTCFIGILTGLYWTLLLLARMQKALPALPISISLSIAFFFLTKFFLIPMIFTLGSQGVYI